MKELVRFHPGPWFMAVAFAAGLGTLAVRSAELETGPVGGDAEARAFVRNVLAAQPERLSIMSGELTAIDPDARRTRLNIKYTVVPEEDGWRGIYETEPSPARGGERLEIIRRTGTNSTFIHFPAGEPARLPGAPVELSWTQAARPFKARRPMRTSASPWVFWNGRSNASSATRGFGCSTASRAKSWKASALIRP